MMHRLSIRLACCAVFVLTIPYALPGESSDRVQEALEILEGEGVLDDPQDVMAWISMPRQLKRKGSAKLEVFVLNGRADDTFRMSQIDIADEFLSGFEILDISPSPRQKDHSMGVLSLEYPLDMAPGESWRLTISLRAKRRGVYIGDIDVLEEESVLTRAAQAQVK
jgi:hypothetical protein